MTGPFHKIKKRLRNLNSGRFSAPQRLPTDHRGRDENNTTKRKQCKINILTTDILGEAELKKQSTIQAKEPDQKFSRTRQQMGVYGMIK